MSPYPMLMKLSTQAGCRTLNTESFENGTLGGIVTTDSLITQAPELLGLELMYSKGTYIGTKGRTQQGSAHTTLPPYKPFSFSGFMMATPLFEVVRPAYL